jgi:hypothetical protein
LNSAPNITVVKKRKIKWLRHVARVGKRRIAWQILLGKPEEKISL